MDKDTQRGKKGTTSRSSKNKLVDVSPASSPAPAVPSRARQAGLLARSIIGKGAHDAAADAVKKALLLGAGALLAGGAAYYFGVDIRPYLGWPSHAQIETGSISKEPAKVAADAAKREIECHVAKAREVDALVERRKAAWGTFNKCKADWTPGWAEKQTADEVCAPHLSLYRQLAQEVRDKEAKDCSATAPPKSVKTGPSMRGN